MNQKNEAVWLKILSAVFLAGTIFAWHTVVVDFIKFLNIEGTVFKVNDCAVPNPVTTACFYGAFGFLAALVWSCKIWGFGDLKRAKNIKYLLLFTVGCVLFAWTNFYLTVARFFSAPAGSAVGCSGQITLNPLTTPCFVGSVIFLTAFVIIYGIFVFFERQK